MMGRVRRWWSNEREKADTGFQSRLTELRQHEPIPVFWLFGRTQSGKTTVIRFLTGASDAEIGNGYQPCTRFSRKYSFPNPEVRLLEFLDTRGIDEPGYDADEDIQAFNEDAHLVVLTAKALDHSQDAVIAQLTKIRAARPTRPVLLLLTCLHEAYPQQQHPTDFHFKASPSNFPFDAANVPTQFADLVRSLETQRQRFADLVDYVLPIDITRPEEGFDQPEYGGDELRSILGELLPKAQRQTLEFVESSLTDLKELHTRKVMPTILGYSLLAGTAGAIPIPFMSLAILPYIQRKMVRAIAKDYGRPESAETFLNLAEQLKLGRLKYHALGELLKVVPSIGIVAGAAGHAAATFALGKSFCHFDAGRVEGALPDLDELKAYYESQMADAAQHWKAAGKPKPATSPESVVTP